MAFLSLLLSLVTWLPEVGGGGGSLPKPFAGAKINRHDACDPVSCLQPGFFGHAVAGDFTGDQVADVVLLKGGRPTLMYGPGSFQSSFYEYAPASGSDQVNDLVLLPGSGETDSMLWVAAEGLIHASMEYPGRRVCYG